MITLLSGNTTVTYDGTTVDSLPVSWKVTEIAELPDAVSCIVTEERNGAYELAMTYSAGGVNAELIQSNLILRVRCPLRNSMGDNLFRIYRVQRNVSGVVSVWARHLSNDMSLIPVSVAYVTNDRRPVSITDLDDYYMNMRVNAQSKIPFLLLGDAGLKVASPATMRYYTPVSARAYLGGQELENPDRTALQLFGGEFCYVGWNVYLYESRGQSRGITINYGHNMNGITIDDDLDDVYTAFTLYWLGEYVLSDGATKLTRVISSPKATSYASLFDYPRIKMVDFTSDVPEDTLAQGGNAVMNWLNNAATAYASQHNDEGNPVRKIDVDVVAAGIDEIYLCDTVRVIYIRNGITVDANMKVVAYEWDVLRERYIKVTLGQIKRTLSKVIAQNMTTTARRVGGN